jgi:hypothetical protein
MKKKFTDRSRIETYQRCHRARFLEYHEAKMGIVSARRPLPLAVGGSCHVGFAILLQGGDEEVAVKAALEDFGQYAGAISLDLSEQTAIDSSTIQSLEAQLLGSVASDPSTNVQIEQLSKVREQSLNAFDRYLFEEQSALVEGLVRAYARRRLRPLLEQYEVLEVEREGQWLLASWNEHVKHQPIDGYTYPRDNELWFMSRPDALLLDKESRQLYLLSFKTAASWDIRKAKDAERDMQGLSEGVEIEKRLATWWPIAHDSHKSASAGEIWWKALEKEGCTPRMWDYLAELSAPPRIMGIRYEYMLKGDRWTDKDLSAELGIELRSQRSHLVRGYMNPGMTADDTQWNWSWDYMKEGGETSKLYWKSWHGTPVWKHMTVKEWIDALDTATETIGEEGRLLGFSCKAQATGFTASHPFDEVFIPPIVVYRNDDDLRDWIEQTEAQEVRVAENVELVKAAKDEGEKRHLLNIYFPQTRRACEYPTTCQFVGLCWGGDDARRDPLGTGKFKGREANHPQELELATAELSPGS